MAATRKKNVRSSSTTYEWRRIKIAGPAPEGPSPTGVRRRWFGLTRRNPKSPITITIRYRGGGESWWFIEARGRSGAFPGHRGLDDVMAEINQVWDVRENFRD